MSSHFRRRVAFSILALVAAPAVLAWLWLQFSDSTLQGISVRGDRLEPTERPKQVLEERAKAWQDTVVTVEMGPYVARGTRAQFGARLDPGSIVDKIRRLGRSGNPLIDLATCFQARTKGISVAWTPFVDRERLAIAVQGIREQLERPPVPGTTDRQGRPIAGIPGLTINSVVAVAAITRGLTQSRTVVKVPARSIPPPEPVPFESPETGLFVVEIASYETKYAVGNRGRATNIETAAFHLDGAYIEPGGELSYNELVGERSLERGFRAALELANRRVVEGVGGGVCQVAATLHAAAFFGGFDIPVYQPHSRPVRYIETGLDTMVAWPNKDLRIRNPYPFRVQVRAEASNGAVRVSLLGAARGHPVEWETVVVARLAPAEKVETDPALGPGETKLIQKAAEGLRLRRIRTVYWPDGPKIEELEIRYPPTPRIVATGEW